MHFAMKTLVGKTSTGGGPRRGRGALVWLALLAAGAALLLSAAMRTRFATTLVLVAGLSTLVMAVPAGAAQTVGADFVPHAFCGGGQTGSTHYSSSIAPPDPYAIPAPGVVTSWSYTTGPTVIPGFRFKVGLLTNAATNTIRTLAQGDALDLPANATTTRPVRIPVEAGQRIGLSIPKDIVVCAGTGPNTKIYSAVDDQPPGSEAVYSTQGVYRYPVSARVEPDADRDNFGDETQDGCPTNAATQGSCPGPPPPPPPPSCPAGTSAGVQCLTVAGVTTIRGTAGNDTIVGGAGRDVIACGSGNDTVRSGAGNDEIRCGQGNDTIDAGPGNDLVEGEADKDKVNGGSGTDRLRGGAGGDTVAGNGGRDNLGGGAGNDKLNGSAGNDRVSGNSGRDSVKGGSGNDRLFGGSGRDRLYGGTGRDRLTGGSGLDRLIGGPGRDSQKQ